MARGADSGVRPAASRRDRTAAMGRFASRSRCAVRGATVRRASGGAVQSQMGGSHLRVVLGWDGLGVRCPHPRSRLGRGLALGRGLTGWGVKARRTRRSTRAADWADSEIKGSWPPPGYLGRSVLQNSRLPVWKSPL